MFTLRVSRLKMGLQKERTLLCRLCLLWEKNRFVPWRTLDRRTEFHQSGFLISACKISASKRAIKWTLSSAVSHVAESGGYEPPLSMLSGYMVGFSMHVVGYLCCVIYFSMFCDNSEETWCSIYFNCVKGVCCESLYFLRFRCVEDSYLKFKCGMQRTCWIQLTIVMFISLNIYLRWPVRCLVVKLQLPGVGSREKKKSPSIIVSRC